MRRSIPSRATGPHGRSRFADATPGRFALSAASILAAVGAGTATALTFASVPAFAAFGGVLVGFATLLGVPAIAIRTLRTLAAPPERSSECDDPRTAQGATIRSFHSR